MFDAFMPVFCVLMLEIFESVIPCVTNEGARVRRAAHEEFVCEVVYGIGGLGSSGGEREGVIWECVWESPL
jgi:hypothetical protein